MENVNEVNAEQHDKETKPDYSAEAFVTRRSSANEISSMLSSLYVTSDREESDVDDNDETRSVVNVLSQTEMVQMKTEVVNVKEQIQALEIKLTDADRKSVV